MRDKSLTSKIYLEQLAAIDEQIMQNLERLSELKTNACSTGGIDYSRERVQSSASGDKLCNDVVRYVSLNEHINAEIDLFVDAKERIIMEIRGLRNKQYIQVLYKVYVQYKTLKVAAAEMEKSYQYVRELHKKALQAFDETYKNLHYLC